MKKVDIIRAWKDEEYRNSLSAEQQASLVKNPAGEISIDELKEVSGGQLITRGDIQSPTKSIPMHCPCRLY